MRRPPSRPGERWERGDDGRSPAKTRDRTCARRGARGVHHQRGRGAGRRAPADAAHLRAQGVAGAKRTSGNTRRYSERDIQPLRQIQDLTQETGVNLAGVKVIIELQAQLDALRARSDELQQQLRAREDQADAARTDGKIVPLRSVFLPPWQQGVRPDDGAPACRRGDPPALRPRGLRRRMGRGDPRPRRLRGAVGGRRRTRAGAGAGQDRALGVVARQERVLDLAVEVDGDARRRRAGSARSRSTRRRASTTWASGCSRTIEATGSARRRSN